MTKAKVLVRMALTCLAALGINAASLAQQKTEKVREGASGTEMRSQATNRALLEALLTRRAEVARSAAGAENNRAARDFLDKRIAEVRSRIEK